MLVGFVAHVWFSIKQNANNLKDETVRAKYGCFYSEYKTQGYSKWATVGFLLVRLVATAGLVYGNGSVYFQSTLFLIVNILALTWTCVMRPQKSIFVFIGTAASETVAVIASGLYVKLCDAGLSTDQVERLGDAIFYMYLTVICGNVGCGLAKIGCETYRWFFPKEPIQGNYAAGSTTEAVGKTADMSNVAGHPEDDLRELPARMEGNFLVQSGDPKIEKKTSGVLEVTPKDSTSKVSLSDSPQ